MMVRSILGLFTRSPFHALQNLGHKVKDCAYQVPLIFDAFFEGDYERVLELAERVSHLEHEADVVKNRVRDELPKTLMMPVDRRDLIDVISSLDGIADCAEDIGVLFTLRKMEPHEQLVEPLRELVQHVMLVVDKACELIDTLPMLADAGFDGAASRRAREMMEDLSALERSADRAQDKLARQLFSIEDDISTGSLYIWNKIFNKIGDMANHAERMGLRMRLFLAK